MSTVRVCKSPDDPQILSSSSERETARAWWRWSQRRIPASRGVRPTTSPSRSASRRPRSITQPSASRISGSAGTAAEGLDPGQELTNRKGLGQIVVGARLEPGDLVVLGSAGGEHQDRQQRSRTAQATADLDAVEIRQHEIEEHEVEGLAGAAVDRGSPVLQGDDIIPRRAQKVGETLAQSPFVLDEKAWSVVLVLAVIVMAGYGSTKAYSADKTVVYRSSMYNISNVTHFTSKVEAKTAEGENVDLTNYDKTRFEAFVGEQGTVMVQTLILMDDETLVYQSATPKKYSEFDKMRKKLASAMDQIAKFMKKKKATQLKLK